MARDFCAYSSTPKKVAVIGNPWPEPPRPRSPGIPEGITLFGNRLVVVDPQLFKYLGEVDSLYSFYTGMKGTGKTAGAIADILRLAPIAAGRDYPRVWINSRKTADGRDEYERLGEALECYPLELVKTKVNQFDLNMGLSPAQLHQIAVNACVTGNHGQLLTGLQPILLQVAMFRMLRDKSELSSTELLEWLVRTIEREDFRAYFEDTNNKLRDSVADTLNRLKSSDDEDERERGVVLEEEMRWVAHKPSHLDWEQARRDASDVSQYLLNILYGELDGLIGGQASLRHALTQQAVRIIWTGVPEMGETLLRNLFNQIRTAAIANNDLALIPHMEVNDEMHKALKNVVTARSASEVVKTIRETHQWRLDITQQLKDYLTVGSEGSEQRALATGMLDGVSMFMTGQVPASEVEIIRQLFPQVSETDGKLMTRLGTGQMAWIVGQRPPLFFQRVLTEFELWLAETNQANQRMVEDRVPVWTTDGRIRIGDRILPLSKGVVTVAADKPQTIEGGIHAERPQE